MNVSSANNFTPNPHPRLLSYYRCCPCLLPHQAVNVSSIDRSTNRRSRSMSLFMSSQTFVGADTSRSYNPRPCYSYNSRHRLDMADSLKMMNQELSRPEDWVPPTVPNPQKKSAELPTINISMIGAAPFNTLMQRAFRAKNMEIFSISIRDIEKALALRSTTNPAKKLPTEYHDFFDVFSRADSDILLSHRLYCQGLKEINSIWVNR